MLGIDSEFKSTGDQVAVLQIASKEKAYVIDVDNFHPEDHIEEWTEFVQEVLVSPPRIILGFDPKCDLSKLAGTHHVFSNLKEDLR